MAQPKQVKANPTYRRGIGFAKKKQQAPVAKDNTNTYSVVSSEEKVH